MGNVFEKGTNRKLSISYGTSRLLYCFRKTSTSITIGNTDRLLYTYEFLVEYRDVVLFKQK